jgi:uncharacterized protein YccT (UPF0319 family)
MLLIAVNPVASVQAFTLTKSKQTTSVPANKARIILTEQLALMKIDEDKYDRYAFSSGDTVVDVNPGPHAFSVRYDWLWEYDYDNFDALKSNPVTLNINTEAGKSYTITHREIPDYQAALVFSRKPEFDVIETGSGIRMGQPTAERQPAAGAASSTPASVSPAAAASTPAAAGATMAANDTAGSKPTAKPSSATPPASLPMLQYWWNQANPAEQEQFRNWIQQ